MTNPYAPPGALDDVRPGGARVSAEEAERIRAEIKRLNRISLSLGAPGLLLQVVGNAMGGRGGGLVTLLGFALLVTGLAFYARMRGRTGWWGAAGILSCLGMILLYFLPKHCHHCSARITGSECAKCGAPASV